MIFQTPLVTSPGLQVAPQRPPMATMKSEVTSPGLQVISSRPKKMPNHLCDDFPGIPKDLSQITSDPLWALINQNYLPGTLQHLLGVLDNLPGALCDLLEVQKDSP